MAYGDWSSSKWKQVWSNGYYKVEVQWRYKQDIINNKTTYAVQQLRVTSLNSLYSFSWTTCRAGIATMGNDRSTQTVSANVPGGGSDTFNLTDKSREISHSSSGDLSGTYNVHGYFKVNVEGNNLPNPGWQVANITEEIPNIDRSGGTTTVSLSKVDQTSATFSYKSNVATTLIQYNLNGQGWKDTGVDLPKTGGGAASINITGLSPGTEYSIQFRHRRDYNQVYSSPKTVSFNTTTPSAPSISYFNVTEIKETSVSFSFDGEYSENYPSQYESDGKFVIEVKQGDQWISKAQIPYDTKSTEIQGLEDNTDYDFRIKLVDYYGTSSQYVSVSIKTLLSGKTVYLKQNGEVRKGLLYICVNQSVYKVKKIYKKQNGQLVEV